MMQLPNSLRGKTILIGRNGNKHGLAVAVFVNGQLISADVDGLGTVPYSVSCIDIDKGLSHCTLSVSNNADALILRNTNPLNRTIVDDTDVDCYVISEKNKVKLGNDAFCLNIRKVLSAASNIIHIHIPESFNYSLNEVERVWNKYYMEVESINRRKRLMNTILALPMVLSAALGLFSKISNIKVLAIIVSIIYVVFFVVRLVVSAKSNDEKIKQWNHYLIDNYRCPNPNCKYSFGKQDFYAVKQLTECPKCKCHYTYSESKTNQKNSNYE